MLGNYLLVAGAGFTLILAIGQLLITRKHSTNRILASLFIVCFIWLSHGIGYRFGLVEQLPHLNKVYLPLLALSGPLWYTYVRCVFNACPEGFNRQYFILPIATIVLSIPFYLQSAAYKRAYIEVNLVDTATVTMYAASRLAELTLLWYFSKTLLFLHRELSAKKSGGQPGITGLLTLLTFTAVLATLVRIYGSVVGSDSISVLLPCLLSVSVFIVIHFLSYRKPAVLSLPHAARHLPSSPASNQEFEHVRSILQSDQLYLNPDLKVQQLALKTQIPVARLSTLINSAAGKNYNEFVNEFRVEHAKTILTETPDVPIIEVAHSSGFNSKSSFYRQFSTVTGMTPAQFRNANSPTLKSA